MYLHVHKSQYHSRVVNQSSINFHALNSMSTLPVRSLVFVKSFADRIEYLGTTWLLLLSPNWCSGGHWLWSNGFRTGTLVTRLRNNTSLVLRTCYDHARSADYQLLSKVNKEQCNFKLCMFFISVTWYIRQLFLGMASCRHYLLESWLLVNHLTKVIRDKIPLLKSKQRRFNFFLFIRKSRWPVFFYYYLIVLFIMLKISFSLRRFPFGFPSIE